MKAFIFDEAFIGEAFIALRPLKRHAGSMAFPKAVAQQNCDRAECVCCGEGRATRCQLSRTPTGKRIWLLCWHTWRRGAGQLRWRAPQEATSLYKPGCLPWAPAQMSSYLMDGAASPKTKAAAKKKQPRNGLASIYILIGPDRGDRSLPGCRDR